MSRTDVHRPKWVQDRDPLTGPMAEVHRHEAGPCDLGEWRKHKGYHQRYRCYVEYVGGRNLFCGCPLCTMHDYRHLGNGRRRAAERADRRALLKDREHEPVIRRHDTW